MKKDETTGTPGGTRPTPWLPRRPRTRPARDAGTGEATARATAANTETARSSDTSDQGAGATPDLPARATASSLVPRPGRPAETRRFSQSMARYMTVGLLTCLLLVFGIGGWSAVARLNSAVVAVGKIVVSSNVKDIQHPEGGVVGEIAVRDGDTVEAGDLLLRLDETITKANREVIDSQLVALEARLARLRAERDDSATIDVAEKVEATLDAQELENALASQRKVFVARRETIEGQIERLTERLDQLRRQIEGYESQRKAKQEEIDLILDELTDLETLLAKGHVPKTRVMALRRQKARLEGERGEFISRIAVTEGRINETQLEILSLRQDFMEKVYSEITEIEPEVANLRERRIAADFQLKHTDIRAPNDGVILNLAAHTVGGVIRPGETIMHLVPGDDPLLVEAQVSPRDIDQISVGQETTVVLSAFDRRNAPSLHGKVTFKAAERNEDLERGIAYFLVRITLDEGEIERLDEGLEIVPGMPAEVYIQTGSRTVIDYLTRPLTDQFRRALTES